MSNTPPRGASRGTPSVGMRRKERAFGFAVVVQGRLLRLGEASSKGHDDE